MATRTLGIKFKVAGVSEAKNSLRQIKQDLNSSIATNKKAIGDFNKSATELTKNEKRRAELVERTNQKIFFSYLGLRTSIKNQTSNILADTKKVIGSYRREISTALKDYYIDNFGSKIQKQNLIIKREKKDFTQRSTYKNLDKNTRNSVLEQRLILKEFILDLKKLIKEDLKETLSETFSEISEKESSFSKVSKVVTMPFKAASSAVMSPISAVIFGALNKIGEEQVKDFAQGVSFQMQKNLGLQLREVGQDIGGAVGSSTYLAYEKIMTATRNSIIDRHPVSGSNEAIHVQKLLDDLGQILQGFVLSLGAIPIKVKKRIDLDKKAIPQVKEKAGELMINRKLTQAQEEEIENSKSITILTGGANYDEQAGTTDFAYRSLQPMLRGSYVHPVKNLFSNAQGTAEFDRVFGQMLSIGLSNENTKSELLQFAKNNNSEDLEDPITDEELEAIFLGDSQEVAQKITDFFKQINIPLPKILEVVFKGYNPDDILMAAEGIFFKEKYPDLPLQFIGTSFGGFNAAGAAEIMNRMGYEDVKAVGVTTPLVGMESTVNPDNYFSSIGDLDFLYEMTLGGVLQGKVPKPDNLQVVPGKGKGHLLGHFLAQSPEFRNYLQHFLKGRVNVPSMQEYSGKEVMAMGRIPGNNAESAIVRTIKKNLGERHDEGYVFNQEDLIAHRDRLVYMAGGADLTKIKNPQLKEFYQDYISFLDTLAEELETIEKFKQVGKKFKPINSLRKAANFYPDLGHFVPNHPDFEITEAEYVAINKEIEQNKNIIAFKRKIDNESGNIERTYRAILGEDISKKGYGYYDESEYQIRANEHLQGLIDYLENGILKNATRSEKKQAKPYLKLLKRLKNTILRVGETGKITTSEIKQAQELLGIDLSEYKKVLTSDKTLNVKERKNEIQSIASSARGSKKSKLVMDVKPELEAYIWAINQELIKEGKEQIDIATAEYLGSGYKNHAIKANGKVYKFTRHTNPLATKVNKMFGKNKDDYQSEIAALKKLQGENAPLFFAGGEEFMAMEEAEGITLKEAFTTASSEERRDLLKKAAKLLKSFHSKGVTHFDFHPGNIIKQKDGNLVAIDWESAQLTQDKKQHYYDREVAVSRFQDILSGSMGVESSSDVAMMFDDAYYGNESRVEIRERGTRTQQEVIERYNQQLAQIIERSTQLAKQAIAESGVSIDPDTMYLAIADRLAEYRRAVEQGIVEEAKRTGELILTASEYLKQIFNESGDSRKGQLTRIQNEIIRGDRGAGRSNVPLAELFYSSASQQLQLDFEEIGEQATEGFNQGVNARASGEEFAEELTEGTEDGLDIQSPSKVFEWIGKMVKAGFELGVKGIFGSVEEELEGVDEVVGQAGFNESINNFLADGIDGISSFFEHIEESFPIIKRFKSSLLGLLGTGLQIFGIYSISEAFLNLVTTSLDAAMSIESLDRSILAVSGNALTGAKNLSFITEEARRLQIDINSAKRAYQGLLGATRNTPLEGFATEQIFSAFAETAKVRGYSPEETSRIFAAIEQSIGKGTLQSEEVKGQLSEVMGDIQNLIASSLGVDVSQLNNMMREGLPASEVWLKVASQLNAQNALLGSSTQTATSAMTRYKNAVVEFQSAIGKAFQPIQKFGLNTLASQLDWLREKADLLIKVFTSLAATIGVNLLLALINSKAALVLLGNALDALVKLIITALPKLLIFLRRFILISAAIETWANVLKLSKTDYAEAEKDIERLTVGVNALSKAFKDATDAKQAFNNSKMELLEGWQLPDNWFGNLLRPIFGGNRVNLDNLVRKRIGITTQAERKQTDFLAASGETRFRAGQVLNDRYRITETITELEKLDAQRREIESARLALLPGDAQGYQDSLDKEKELLEQRDKLLKRTSQYQQNLDTGIQALKRRLAELAELDLQGGDEEDRAARDRERTSLLGAIEELETEKKAVNKELSSLANLPLR